MSDENHQKLKLLKIMEILRHETDEDHPMTKSELSRQLVSMKISCNKRSLNRDVSLLNESGYEIMETFVNTDGKNSSLGRVSPGVYS